MFFVIAGLVPVSAHSAARFPAYGKSGMVVSSSADAAEAGASILAAGGNAIDAAVATAFAVGVTQPYSAGIGGGAFLLIRPRERQGGRSRRTRNRACGRDPGYVRGAGGTAEGFACRPVGCGDPRSGGGVGRSPKKVWDDAFGRRDGACHQTGAVRASDSVLTRPA